MRYPKTSRRKIGRKTHKKKYIFGGNPLKNTVNHNDIELDFDDEYLDNQPINPVKTETYSPDDNEIKYDYHDYPQHQDSFKINNPMAMRSTRKNNSINPSNVHQPDWFEMNNPMSAAKPLNVYKSLQPAFSKIKNDRLTRKNTRKVPIFSKSRAALNDLDFESFIDKHDLFGLLYDILDLLFDLEKDKTLSNAQKIEIVKQKFTEAHFIYSKIEANISNMGINKDSLQVDYLNNARNALREIDSIASNLDPDNGQSPSQNSWGKWLGMSKLWHGGKRTRKLGRRTRRHNRKY